MKYVIYFANPSISAITIQCELLQVAEVSKIELTDAQFVATATMTFPSPIRRVVCEGNVVFTTDKQKDPYHD